MTAIFVQTLIDALTLGALYALIALGYTMVYGVLGFINFAHSDIFAIGGWTAVLTASLLGLSALAPDVTAKGWEILIVLPAAMIICALLAFIVERLAYRPLMGAPKLNVLITAIGVSLLLQNAGQLPWAFGTEPRRMPELINDAVLINSGGVRFTMFNVLAIASALGLMLGLELLIYRTKFGRAMRAVSFNANVASLMGINVGRIIDLTFIIGGALAGAAAVLFAMKYTVQQPASGIWLLLGLKAFIAAVIGGIGNVRGAMIGGFLIAIIEQFGGAAQQFIPSIPFDTTVYRDVYCFAILILLLLIRPGGLFGSAAAEKV